MATSEISSGATGDRVRRKAELRAVDGLSDTTRWRLIRAGRYPAPIRLSTRAVGWLQSDLDAWLQARRGELAERLEAGR